MSERKTPWTPGPYNAEAPHAVDDDEGYDSEGPLVFQALIFEPAPRQRQIAAVYGGTYTEALGTSRLFAEAPAMAAHLAEICDPDFGKVWGSVTALDRWRYEARALLAKIGATP